MELLNCKFSQQQAGMFVWAKASPPKESFRTTPPKEGLKKNSYGLGGTLSDKILYEYGVFITPGGIFGSEGNKYIRVSLCSPVEKFEEAITRIKAPLIR